MRIGGGDSNQDCLKRENKHKLEDPRFTMTVQSKKLVLDASFKFCEGLN